MAITFNPLTGQFDITGSGGAGSSPSIGGPITGGTDKSVLFVHPSGTIAQDNADFNYDQSTNTLSVAGQVLTTSIDRATAGTLSIGTTVNSTVINIGNAGATVNIQGTTLYENVTQLEVADPLITLNKGGGAGSAQDSGIQLEENAVITGYAKTSLDRNSWLLKAPNTAGDVTLTPGAGGILINQSSHDPVTLAAVGASPNANAASLSGQILTLQPANGTNPGVITAGAQTIGGAKTFTGAITASNLSGTNTGDVTIGTANGLSIVGQVLSMDLADGIVTGTLSPTDYNAFDAKVDGPASATDNAVARYDGTTGKLIQNSGASIDDAGNITATNLSGTNTGNVTLGPVGTSSNVNGATITGQVLALQEATATFPGVVSEVAQTFGGSKRFIGTVRSDIAFLLKGAISNSIVSIQAEDNTVSYSLTLPPNDGNSGQVLTTDGSGVLSWNNASAGTVTSVALTVPSFLTVAGSPVTSSGTLAVSLANQTANTVFAGPATGSPAAPTFRSLVAADIPLIDLTTGVTGILPLANGGTNANLTASAGSVAYSDSTGIAFTAVGTSGQYLVSQGTSAPIWVTIPAASPGDIGETSFTAADNQAAPDDVVGLAFANATVQSFEALVSIVRDATYEVYKLNGIQKASSWEMEQSAVGDDTGIVFSITTAGQVQYTSTSTGFTALVKFRAITTSV